jgi:hypothetical protein
MILSRSSTFPMRDGPEVNGPAAVVGFVQAEVMLFGGVGDEEQFGCEPEGAGLGDALDRKWPG